MEQDLSFPRAWMLTRTQERFLIALSADSSGFASSARLLLEMRNGMTKLALASHIHVLRIKLEPFGILIETVRDSGYRLPRESLEKVRDSFDIVLN